MTGASPGALSRCRLPAPRPPGLDTAGGLLAEPAQVAPAAVADRCGGDLGDLVGMVGGDQRGQFLEAADGGLADAEPLRGDADRSPPPVGAADRADDLHRRGHARLDDAPRELPGLLLGRDRGTDLEVARAHRDPPEPDRAARLAGQARSSSSRSAGSSTRSPAPSQPSTCAGRREPAIAAVTPGWASTQATATAATVAPWRAASGRSTSVTARLASSRGAWNSRSRRRQ